jgi:peptide methionine sulfoxide reductase MsrA
VVYDDEKVSYSELLDSFFLAQEPKFDSRQYGSMIFPHDEQQQKTASEWLQNEETRADGVSREWTRLEVKSNFWKAEEYHQRYWQKQRPRLAFILGLIAISSGICDSFTPENIQEAVHTTANTIALLGCGYSILERKLDQKTVKM